MSSKVKKYYSDNLTFDDFKKSASDKSLSMYEKIGFPDSYRKGYEKKIFDEILKKLFLLRATNKKVLDIGPGCTNLPNYIIKFCKKNKHHLFLLDCQEMLNHFQDEPFITKISGSFPNSISDPFFLKKVAGKIDIIICYSVFHYIFNSIPCHHFIDQSLSLLSPGGQMLIGDIPNVSLRKRFFKSEAGIAYHRKFMNTDKDPDIIFNTIEFNKIDDSVIFYIIDRARAQGYNAFIVPQGQNLPMANRREDILIFRP